MSLVTSRAGFTEITNIKKSFRKRKIFKSCPNVETTGKLQMPAAATPKHQRILVSECGNLEKGRAMKNTSKLSLFTVVLRALLLFMPVSAFAAAEDGQEIGAPQMMESFAKSCFGAVMSPDGKRIYILREGQLMQYQFNPFKKLGSIAVESAQVKSFKYAGPCNVGLTRDESKIIIVSNIDISLFDAQTGRLLKSVNTRDYPGSESESSIDRRMAFNGDDLVIMFGTRIYVLDANTLTYKHKEIDIGKKCGFEIYNYHLKTMKNVMGSLYFISPRNVVVLNGETYECELSAKINEVDGGKQQISRDFRTLALKGVTEFRDYRRSSPARYDDMKKDDVLFFDLDTRTAKVNKDSFPFKGVYIYDLRSSIQADGHSFFSRRYHRSPNAVDTAIIDERVRKFTVITTYEAGEAISMEAFPGSKYGNFQMTPGARKYLMMKNGEGKDVPMNDATFNKYYRTAFEN